MTLTAFPPEALDALALRLLDAAAAVRHMAERSREVGLEDFHLHGNKAQDWLSNLEAWTHDGTARIEAAALKQRGAQRAAQSLMVPARRGGGPGGKARKPK